MVWDDSYSLALKRRRFTYNHINSMADESAKVFSPILSLHPQITFLNSLSCLFLLSLSSSRLHFALIVIALCLIQWFDIVDWEFWVFFRFVFLSFYSTSIVFFCSFPSFYSMIVDILAFPPFLNWVSIVFLNGGWGEGSCSWCLNELYW